MLNIGDEDTRLLHFKIFEYTQLEMACEMLTILIQNCPNVAFTVPFCALLFCS
jgi:hypothetical protein